MSTSLQANCRNPYVIRAANGWRATLYLMDCLAGMRKFLSDESVDVVVTSPPYNIGIQYSEYSDNRRPEDYLDWIQEWAMEVKRVLRDDGSLFLNIGGKPSDPTMPFEVAQRLQKIFKLQNVIIWVKSIAIEEDNGKSIAVGHFKPINGPRYLNNTHEFIFHLTKYGKVKLDRLAIGVKYKDKSNITRWKKAASDSRCRGNVWFIPYKTIRERKRERPHPATFPVKLANQCITLHGLRKGLTVLDPFLGIGHAAIAAGSLEADFIGFEIDKTYFQEACSILESQKEDLLVDYP